MRVTFLLLLLMLASLRLFALPDSFALLNLFFIMLGAMLLLAFILLTRRHGIIKSGAFIAFSLAIIAIGLKQQLLPPGYTSQKAMPQHFFNSAYPTIKPDDVILTRYFNVSRERGEMVAIHLDNLRIKKRIQGIPGDSIRICDNEVFINGYKYRAEENWQGQAERENMLCFRDKTLKLGPDQYFVLGDNYRNSTDSRDFGAIAGAAIVGNDVYLIRFSAQTNNSDKQLQVIPLTAHFSAPKQRVTAHTTDQGNTTRAPIDNSAPTIAAATGTGAVSETGKATKAN